MTNDDLSRIERIIGAGQHLPPRDGLLLLEQLRSNAAEAVRVNKRLADAERNLRPSTEPNAMARALRDLTVLERLREHSWAPRCIEMLREEAVFLEHVDGAEGKVEVYRMLVSLLEPTP